MTGRMTARRPPVAPRPLSEQDWQARVLDLAEHTRWLRYHVYDSRRSAPGFPDLTLLRGDQLVFAELKSAGGRVTPAQQVWLDGLTRVRHLHVHVWRPGDWRTVQDVLR
jgi:hypothetical protein